MKIKTEYSLGDIVVYHGLGDPGYIANFKRKIGRIVGIEIKMERYDAKDRIDVKYIIDQIPAGVADEEVTRHNIISKLDKKAFRKEYAKQCARDIWGR